MSNTNNKLNSSKFTKVFPCVSRDLQDKLISEENITSLVKIITDTKAFVINDTLKDFEFVIDGYYFKADISEYTRNYPGPVYAQIHYKESSPYTIIEGDNGDEFDGITFSGTVPASATTTYLQLWDGEGVPSESKIKFNLQSSNISFDFGELS